MKVDKEVTKRAKVLVKLPTLGDATVCENCDVIGKQTKGHIA